MSHFARAISYRKTGSAGFDVKGM